MGLGAPAPGEAPGLQRFSATASSPRRDTRTASASATAGRSRNSRVATKTDRSTARGRKGRLWASPKTSTSPGWRRLAPAILAEALSSPTTRGTLIHAPLRSSKVSGAGTRTSSSIVVVAGGSRVTVSGAGAVRSGPSRLT